MVKPTRIERLNATFDYFSVRRTEQAVLTRSLLRMSNLYGNNPDTMPLPGDDRVQRLFEMYDYYTYGHNIPYCKERV